MFPSNFTTNLTARLAEGHKYELSSRAHPRRDVGGKYSREVHNNLWAVNMIGPRGPFKTSTNESAECTLDYVVSCRRDPKLVAPGALTQWCLKNTATIEYGNSGVLLTLRSLGADVIPIHFTPNDFEKSMYSPETNPELHDSLKLYTSPLAPYST